MARPTQFNREDATKKAMHLFWERGFQSTSMTDLVEAMDMRPGSIYAAFQNKESLVIAAMDHYAAEAGECCTQITLDYQTVREMVEAVFQVIIDEMDQHQVPRGCLLVNIFLELSTVNETIAKHARQHLEQTKLFIKNLLERAHETGELDAEKSPEELSIFLFGIFYSLRVMGKAGATCKELKTVVDQAIHHVFG